MQRHLKTTGILLLLSALAPGCDGATPWSDDEEQPPTTTEQPDFGPTAAYDRRMIFLGAGDDLPTAAVLDLQTLSDSVGIRRGVRARAVDGREWIRLLDAGWEMEPMREPWRLVPHGSLRMIVSDAGEVEAVEVRHEEVPVRLEPGAVIAEHAPDAGTQLVLREATLLLENEPHTGVLLDAQLGRSVRAGFLPRVGGTRADSGPDAAGGEAAGSGSTGAADSAGPVAPTARPGTEALLLDAGGYYMVLASSANGRIAWIHNAGRSDAVDGVRLEPTATVTFTEGAVEVPSAWRVMAPDGGVMGELRAEAADRAVLTEPPGVSALGYVLVSGWIEDRRVRREVFGLVRHIR